MDFGELHDRLVARGYSDDTADAKIAHDIVLKAVRDSGFHDNITVKGGVVMSGDFLKLYVFGDKKMRERRMVDVVRRLQRIFSSKQFMRGLTNPSHAWLAVSPTDATDKILAYISSLRDTE